jgi:predicted DNA-binding protein
MKANRDGNTLSLRLSPRRKARIERLQRATSLSASDIARLAIETGLRKLEKGEFPSMPASKPKRP